MSNLTQLFAASGPTVAPGTVTSSPYYTSVGWSAGEYIYSTPTGAIAPRTIGGLGYNATYNAGSILSGSSWTPATLQNIQYGPMLDYGTFAGTSQTAGVQSGSATTIASAVCSSVYSFNLINGNICTVYASSNSAYFTIYTPAGSVVVAATLVTGSSGIGSDRYSVSGCCLTGGIIVITFGDGSGSYFATYTQAGVAVTAKTTFRAAADLRYHQTIALSNGNWAVVGSTSNGAQYLMVLTATGTDVLGGPVATGLTQMGMGVCCQLPNGNIAFGGLDVANSRIGVGVITTAGAQIWNGYPEGCNNYPMNVVPLPSSNFAIIYSNGSNQGVVRVMSRSANSTISNNNLGSTNIGGGCVGALQLSAALLPTIYVAGNSNGGAMSLYGVSFANTNGTSGTIFTINNSITASNNNPWIVNSLNGKVLLSWQATSTNYPTRGFWNTQTLTNGSTVLYGASFTPKENWFLLGISATTVAAGDTGPVITNGGSVALNANYPTITTPISFNYQGASNNFAQRGTVVNKVATLKGLEL
jgi:hypothetical protein